MGFCVHDTGTGKNRCSVKTCCIEEIGIPSLRISQLTGHFSTSSLWSVPQSPFDRR